MGARLLTCKILSWMIQDLQKQIKQGRDDNVDIDSNEESDDCEATDASTVNRAAIAKAIVNHTSFNDILNAHSKYN